MTERERLIKLIEDGTRIAYDRQALEHMPSVLMRDNVTYRNAVRFGLIKYPDNPKVEFYFEKVKYNDNDY